MIPPSHERARIPEQSRAPWHRLLRSHEALDRQQLTSLFLHEIRPLGWVTENMPLA